MAELFDLEDIEETRRREGADDSPRRRRVVRLQAGDRVRLTVWLGGRVSETLTFRILRTRGAGFEGVLVETPAADGELRELKVGLRVPFASRHIHSVLRQQPAV
jgi:hypothetical protein